MDQSSLEVEKLKSAVSCAVVLERARPPWQIDAKESSRNALKYRRGKGEIIIVSHAGRGWWAPADAEAKGDVFGLVQHLEPGLSFGQVRCVLRKLVGLPPAYPRMVREGSRHQDLATVAERWTRRGALVRGSATWRYLSDMRCLPADILALAAEADDVREGPRGSAWFAHRNHDGRLTGFEMRGPDFRGFSSRGRKSLFRVTAGSGRVRRLAVCEGPIDAMSLAAIERLGEDTLYVATGGGMAPGTLSAITSLLTSLALTPGTVLVAATDADASGERYVGQLTRLAAGVPIPVERPRPPAGLNDWNDALNSRDREGHLSRRDARIHGT